MPRFFSADLQERILITYEQGEGTMLAHAYLTIVRQHGIGGEAPVVQAAGLPPLTVPEVRWLLWHLVWERPPSVEAVEHWSAWRRRHQ
jgi:hypothetical protein